MVTMARFLQPGRRRDQTRAHRLAVDEHRARTALSLAASLLRARESAFVAEHVEQARHRMRLDFVRVTVQRELHWAISSGIAGISRTSRP